MPDPPTDSESTPKAIERVAVAACHAAGVELRRRYEADDSAGEYSAHDVKAAADEAAEAKMLPVVRQAFPEHTVVSEEAGRFEGSAPYRWILDPLDGTNNFAAGLPTFTTAATVLYENSPIVAVIYAPITDETWIATARGDATADGGVRYNGEPVRADSDLNPTAGTVSFTVGRNVPADPELAEEAHTLRSGLEGAVKRVVPSWAPTYHAGLLARGRIEGYVAFHPDEDEQAAVELLADEAGCVTYRDGPLYVAGTDDAMLETVLGALGRDGR